MYYTKLKHYRKCNKLSQEQMADTLCVSKRIYQHIESGHQKTFDIELLKRISDLIGLTVDQLIINDQNSNVEENFPNSKKIEIKDDNNIDCELESVIKLLKQKDEIIAVKEKLLTDKDLIISSKEAIIEKLKSRLNKYENNNLG